MKKRLPALMQQALTAIFYIVLVISAAPLAALSPAAQGKPDVCCN